MDIFVFDPAEINMKLEDDVYVCYLPSDPGLLYTREGENLVLNVFETEQIAQKYLEKIVKTDTPRLNVIMAISLEGILEILYSNGDDKFLFVFENGNEKLMRVC